MQCCDENRATFLARRTIAFLALGAIDQTQTNVLKSDGFAAKDARGPIGLGVVVFFDLGKVCDV